MNDARIQADEAAITKAKELAKELRTNRGTRQINAVLDSIISVLQVLKSETHSDSAKAAYLRAVGVCREHRPLPEVTT
jgi:hypothetical protein